MQTEKGVLEAALQHEVTAQASAQAQLNIFQAKLSEAVLDLEKRCAGTMTPHASQLCCADRPCTVCSMFCADLQLV